MKRYYLTLTVVCILAAIGCVMMSSQRSKHVKPEMPVMQQFSSSPRFENEQTIFGETYDLSRFDLHERYDRELTNICYTHNNSLQTIKRANRFFPILEPILREENIPTDMLYLCCIESSLNIRAKSPVGAAGLWQFMPETGRQYGLTVNDEVDERYHVVKATHAACRYFRDAYQRFGNWIAVAASYNGGMGGLRSKLNAQQVSRPMDLLLPEETSRYMFRIMAFKELLRDPYRYGFVLYSDQLYRPIRTTQVTVTATIPDLAKWAIERGINYMLLKEFNPWLRDNKLTIRKGVSYQIDLPVAEDMNYDAAQPFQIYDTAWVVDK